jgi:phosphate starvation-inducible PhoH-like protein
MSKKRLPPGAAEVYPDNGSSLKIKSRRLTSNQLKLLKLSLEDRSKVIFVSGPAGSTKTYMAVYSALKEIRKNNELDLLYVRTAIESAEKNLGFLPGDVEDKFNPYMAPLEDKLLEILGNNESPSALESLMRSGRIRAMPVNFLRGASWVNKIIVADEAQNFTFNELVTLITRIGENCKLFICGDLMQSDINGKSGFGAMIKAFNDEESRAHGIHCFEFSEEDICRSEILKFIIRKIKK